MYFLIYQTNGEHPAYELGPRGQELNYAFPDGHECHQENYGQGEGQFWHKECVWGVYISQDPNGIVIHLHQGRIELSEALAFVEAIRQKIFQDQETILSFQGEERDWGDTPGSACPA